MLLVAVVALQALGCDEGITAGVAVDNRTSSELHVQVQLEDADWYSPPGTVGPHESELVLPAAVMPPTGCTAGSMIALDATKREVARHEAPLCIDDIWIIDSLVPPTSS